MNEFNPFQEEKARPQGHDRRAGGSRSRSRSRCRAFRSFKSFGNPREEEEEVGLEELLRKDLPPVESFVNTQDFFISALNDCKGSLFVPRGLNIREQVDDDNKAFDEKRHLPTENSARKKSNERQPQHRSVLQRINNEKPGDRRSENSEKNASEGGSSHRRHKRAGSNDSKSKKSKKIAKKHSSLYYSGFSKKKSPREEFEKYLAAEPSARAGASGGHYERQLLKKYKGEKLAEFIEKVSGAKGPKEFGSSYGTSFSLTKEDSGFFAFSGQEEGLWLAQP